MEPKRIDPAAETEVAEAEQPSRFTLRPLKATDLKPLTQIVSKIGLKQFAPALQSMGADAADSASVGLAIVTEAVGIVLENYDKCEAQLFDFCASLSGLTLKEVQNLPIDAFAELVMEIIKKEEFASFFKVAQRLFQ